jgi:hypothetical protein
MASLEKPAGEPHARSMPNAKQSRTVNRAPWHVGLRHQYSCTIKELAEFGPKRCSNRRAAVTLQCRQKASMTSQPACRLKQGRNRTQGRATCNMLGAKQGRKVNRAPKHVCTCKQDNPAEFYRCSYNFCPTMRATAEGASKTALQSAQGTAVWQHMAKNDNWLRTPIAKQCRTVTRAQVQGS